MEHLFELASLKIDEESAELQALSRSIWENPEQNFQEEKSHQFLTEFLETRGFRVTRNYVLDTAFKAEWGEEPEAGGKKVVVFLPKL